MPVVSVPHVVVLEPVDVHLQMLTVVEVDVSNEENVRYAIRATAFRNQIDSEKAVFYLGPQSPPAYRTN